MNPSSAVCILAVIALTSVVPLTGSGSQTNRASPEDYAIVGDWRGDSICMARESACRDEDSLYHVAKLAGKPGWFSMKLDKIVDGKPVTMGTTECSYDSAKRALTCEFPRGVFRFTIQANKMAGTMSLTDGTLWRKLALSKSS